MRAPGERPFAVIKRVFHEGHVLVTTVQRVRVKLMFACFCFNLVQLGSLGWAECVGSRSADGEVDVGGLGLRLGL